MPTQHFFCFFTYKIRTTICVLSGSCESMKIIVLKKIIKCNMPYVLFFFMAAKTNYHKLHDLTEIYSFVVLEFRSPKWRYWQGWFLLGALWENLFQVSCLISCSFKNTWCSLPCGCITPISIFIFHSFPFMSLFVYLSVSLSFGLFIWFRVLTKQGTVGGILPMLWMEWKVASML